MPRESIGGKWQHTYKRLLQNGLSISKKGIFEIHNPCIQTQKEFYLNTESYSFLEPLIVFYK
jgi:hypothetical protein